MAIFRRRKIMVLNFIAIALVISLLMPGSMLSAFDSSAKTERMAQLPVKQASLAEARRCTRFGQEARPPRC
jgi:hypothetical protein